jgi:hypothetical protein
MAEHSGYRQLGLQASGDLLGTGQTLGRGPLPAHSFRIPKALERPAQLLDVPQTRMPLPLTLEPLWLELGRAFP